MRLTGPAGGGDRCGADMVQSALCVPAYKLGNGLPKTGTAPRLLLGLPLAVKLTGEEE